MWITDSYVKAESVYAKGYKTILVSISGGSDSDLLVDICTRLDPDSTRTIYVWFNTGVEYQATKDHLKYLENRYGINIVKTNAKMPIPLAIKKYGQPFMSKNVSEFMSRLQKHNFQWEDKPYDVLVKKYPNCQSALEWWCNKKKSDRMNIRNNKWLKEFIIANPPQFKISNLCCQKAKKDTAKQISKLYHNDLDIIGIRKAEGGARATRKNCFMHNKANKTDNYAPIFWYKQEDKEIYEKTFNIQHSACYTTYGLPRTGCAGCPCGKQYKNEIAVCEKYEPKLAKAVKNIFKDSYAYTEAYEKFRKKMNKKKKKDENICYQYELSDFFDL